MKPDERKAKEEVRIVEDRNDKDRHKHRSKPHVPHNGKKKTRSDKKRQDDVAKQQNYQCFNCGSKQKHKLESCPAFGKVCKACNKRNHFASVCRSVSCTSQVKQMASISDSSEAETSETESDKFFFKVEEVSSVQAKGKQLFAVLEFTVATDRFKTTLECQLDTGATCNVLSHRDLSVINQDGNPALQTSKVRLRLFNGSVMKLFGEVTLKVCHKYKQQYTFKFQVVEGESKPLLSAETCETLGLLKINCDLAA